VLPRRGPGAAGGAIVALVTLLAAAGALWFALGMNRGVLLSEGIRSRIWPWAPFHPPRPLMAPGLSDPVWQFAPWAEFARAELREGRLPLWNPHQDGGVPLLGNSLSALGSPLFWPTLALGVTNGWNLSLLFRLLVALSGAWAFLRDRGRSTEASALGAFAFGLSGAFVAWLGHPQTLAAAPIPFVLLFAGRLAERASRRDTLLLAVATYLVLSGGHPETALLSALLAAAYTAVRARSIQRWAATSGAALLGAFLAAPLWLPFGEYFLLSEAREGLGRHPFVLPASALLRLLAPGAPFPNAIETAVAVSLAVLCLAPASLLRRPPGRETLFWLAVAGASLLVSYDNPVARLLAQTTDIHWTRALLFLPIPLGFLAASGLDALVDRARRAGRGRAARAVAAAFPALAALELLLAARGVHTVTPKSDLTLTTPLLERLREDRGVFRILPLHTFLPPNSATPLGLDDVRGYDALTPASWRRVRASLGRFAPTPTVTDTIAPWDLRPGGVGLDFWNVKYLLLHPQFPFGEKTLNQRLGLDLEEVYTGPDGRILRNRRVLPRARLEGGPGEVAIVEHVPTRWTLDVTAGAPARLVVANPFFPGWKMSVDGRGIAPLAKPGDPITVPVDAGRHRVVLAYRPGSLRAGLALAAAAALALALLVRRS
jgi:hypothetical protein